MIPIYRGKKIDSDEYVEGFLVIDKKAKKYFITSDSILMYNKSIEDDLRTIFNNEIDPTTLAIHFSDIPIENLFFGIDNGKGASIIEAKFIDDNTMFKGIAIHTQYGYVFYDKNDDWVHVSKLFDIKVIGIQE